MKSKLSDFSYLTKNPRLRPHIPVTRPFNENIFHQMLENHSILYIKPDNSLKGHGIIRIDKNDKNYILRVQDTQKYYTFSTTASLWNAINQAKRKQSYIIQQGILSLTSAGKPFDVRVHLVRVNETWHVGGLVAKLANKKSIVTNGAHGAAATQIDDLLKSHLNCSLSEASDVKNQLKRVSLNAVKALRAKNPKWWEYGLDIGIDEDRQPWIYEMNTLPALTGFREIDPSAYNRILTLRKLAS